MPGTVRSHREEHDARDYRHVIARDKSIKGFMDILQCLRSRMLPTSFSGEACGSIGLRRKLALPIYTLALIFDVAASALGRLAALVAGDDWPE